MTFTEWWSKEGTRSGYEYQVALRAWNAAMEQRADVDGGWVSVKDRLPITHEVVRVQGGVAHWNGTEWRTITGYEWPGRVIQWNVTHWKPLTNPPSNSDGSIK